MASNAHTGAPWHKFRVLDTQRAFEPIVTQIRQAIYRGDLKPGDKLPTERELSQIFQASRVSVRNAILSLEQAGFLEIKKGANGGFFVIELDDRAFRNSLSDLIKVHKASVRELSEARSIIEPQAAALAAQRAEPEDLLRIERTIDDFHDRSQQHADPDPGDLDFHESVARASHNAVIIFVSQALMKLLFQSIGSYTLPLDVNQQIIKDHSLILDAIRDRDSDRARYAMLRHVEIMENMLSRFETEPGAESAVGENRIGSRGSKKQLGGPA